MTQNIVIVDPDEQFSRHVEQTCKNLGFGTVVLDGSQNLVEHARRLMPSLIILNLELPRGGTSGFSECSRLKRNQELANIPIILMSATATPQALEKHSKSKTPADAYLHKPFGMEELASIIHDALGEAAGENEVTFADDSIQTSVSEDDAVSETEASGHVPPALPKKQRPIPSASDEIISSLDELLAKARVNTSLPPPAKATGVEGRLESLRHNLAIKEVDLKNAKALWIKRERENAEVAHRAELQNRELDRAKRARETLVEQLTNAEDDIGSLKADVEIGRERTERLEREKAALAEELQDSLEHYEDLHNSQRSKIGTLEEELENARSEHEQIQEALDADIGTTKADLERVRHDFSALQQEHDTLKSEHDDMEVSLKAKVAELDVQLDSTASEYRRSQAKGVELASMLQELQESKARGENEASARIHSLEESKLGLERENENLNTSFETVRAESAKRGKAVVEARKELTELRSTHAEIQGQATDLAMQLDQARTKGDAVTLELDELGVQHNALLDKTRNLEQKLVEESQALKSSRRRAEKFEKQLEETLGEHRLREEDFNTRLASAETSLGEARVELDGERLEVQNLQAELETRNTELSRAKEEIVEAKEEFDSARTDLEQKLNNVQAKYAGQKTRMQDAEKSARQREAALQQEIDDGKIEREQVEQAHVRTQGKLAEAEALVAETREKISTLAGKLQRRDAEVAGLKKDQEDANQARQEAEDQLDLEQDRVKKLRRDLENARDEHVREVESQQSVLAQNAQEASAHVEQLARKVRAAKEKMSAFETEIHTLEKKNLRADEELTAVRVELEAEQHAKSALKDKLRILEPEVERAKTEAEDLADENQRTTGLLKKARAERDELKRRHVDLLSEQKELQQNLDAKLQAERQKAKTDTADQADEVARARRDRDEAKRLAGEYKKTVTLLKTKYNNIVAQAKEIKGRYETKVAGVAKRVTDERAERARDKARFESELDRIQRELSEAEERANASVQEELITLRATLEDRESRVKELSGEIEEEKATVRKLRSEMTKLAEKAADVPEDTTDYLDKYEEVVRKRSADQEKFKQRYDALQEDYEKTRAKLEKVMARIKKAKEAKASKRS